MMFMPGSCKNKINQRDEVSLPFQRLQKEPLEMPGDEIYYYLKASCSVLVLVA